MNITRWIPHLVVALVAAGQFALARAWHQTEEELNAIVDEQTEEGDGAQVVHALHILTNRGSSPHTVRTWDKAAVSTLLNHADPLVQDFAYTVDICRMVQPVWQEKRISTRLQNQSTELAISGEDFGEWLRHYLLYRRKVAGRHMGAMMRLKVEPTNDEVAWILASISGAELDKEHVLASIYQRQTGANMARTKRMAAPDPEGKKERRARRADGGSPNRSNTDDGR